MSSDKLIFVDLQSAASEVREATGLSILDAKALLYRYDGDVDKVIRIIETTSLDKLFPGRLDQNRQRL